jgi:hypothetical protein
MLAGVTAEVVGYGERTVIAAVTADRAVVVSIRTTVACEGINTLPAATLVGSNRTRRFPCWHAYSYEGGTAFWGA